jgi:glycosyltransferase involved in cell wall biosynthesis
VEGEAYELFIREGQGGVAYEPGSVDSLARQVSWLIDHPNEREEMGRKGRQFVIDKFDREQIHNRLMAELALS